MMCVLYCIMHRPRFFSNMISCEILVARPAAKFVFVCEVGLLLITRSFENTCNMLSFQLDATKRAIEFAGKKNSNFFELFSAKLIWFCHCHREQGNTGLTRKNLHLLANPGHILDFKNVYMASKLRSEMLSA